MLSPYELQVFLAAAEAENLAAARKLHLTQSAVSHRQHASSNAHLKFYEYVCSPVGQAILRRLGIKGASKT